MSRGPAAFIAVQCYQCSTMQVKQEKKSSNKWRCVICNERQSVRKVFARSFLAKDVRGFVQVANAARQRSESASFWPESDSQASAVVGERISLERTLPGKTRKRNDWSEYLEPEEDDDDANGGGMLEPGFVTELPKETMRKPKRKFPSPFCGVKEDHPPSSSSETGRRPATRYGRDAQNTEDGLSKTKDASKWSEYLDVEEDSNDGSSEKLLPNHGGGWNYGGAFETHIDGEKVEEDIHPDFM
ncbi:uncharacterized protein LOC116256685 [Nymphaea colorata]|nr:uncharacterized protein LOC116256685 [Nymphaea colorata]